MSSSRHLGYQDEAFSEKRSRFSRDSASKERPRESRTYREDDRSLSPPAYKNRSSFNNESEKSTQKPPLDPVEAAAAAAKRVAESLRSGRSFDEEEKDAKKEQNSESSVPLPNAPAPPLPPNSQSELNDLVPPSIADIAGKVIEGEEVFTINVEINNVKNRYILVKSSTLSEIEHKSGVQLYSKGRYYPNKALASDRDPPLYLHIVASSTEDLSKALAELESWIHKDIGPLVDERRFRRRDDMDRNPSQGASPQGNSIPNESQGMRKRWNEEKVYINLTPTKGFHLRQAVVGPQGAYVKHIQQETRTRVQIKGQGSAFIEPSTNRESDEPLHLCIMSHDMNNIQKAKPLCEDLIANVHQQYQAWKTQYREGGQGSQAYKQSNRNHYSNRSSKAETPSNHGTPPISNVSPVANFSAPTSSTSNVAPATSIPAAAYPPGTSPAVPMVSPGMPYVYGAPGMSGPPGIDAPGVGISAMSAPGADPYAAFGGYNAYVQYYQQQIYAQSRGANPPQ
ncbi:KH domain RNA-binding protein, involved in splicing [Schizosaccharomyces osmophilus]|uniref:KH domain RNA-binding protein, involved in splicing n=1 Tax=Schizosaccharomyces osmophilus TaxID=2545709 RepID=A0AAE9W867_9SCHI|nr:KH domain RNA-binding protein, involved in splicing [Schizosaccharomyces osmophilus]WBW71504.1 KH domain RNA-binding protein, involved in splicing [Schizosaccharomyces osmophilus]